jgi:hypothetical protein
MCCLDKVIENFIEIFFGHFYNFVKSWAKFKLIGPIYKITGTYLQFWKIIRDHLQFKKILVVNLKILKHMGGRNFKFLIFGII